VSGVKEKAKEDEYKKSLLAYSQAIKAFHKSDHKKAAELFRAILEKHPSEKELVDRARIHLSICENQMKKSVIPMKTFNDYYYHSVVNINRGQYEEALKLLEKAREMKPKEGKISFLIANVHCLLDQEDECLNNLKKAIHLDKYFKTLAQNDPDFEPLWENKKFKIITKMA